MSAGKTNITCAKMTAADLPQTRALLRAFFAEDEFYLDSARVYGDSGPVAIDRALDMFLKRPELGFVWLARQENEVGGKVAGLCVICYAVSTSLGALVAKLDDVFIADGARGQGAGSAMLAALGRELKAANVLRIDTAVHLKNAEAARFYARCGFKPLNEERLSLLL